MKKSMVLIIVIAIVLLIIGAIVGYLYFSGFFNHREGKFPGGNIQLNQAQVYDVTSFFDSNPNQDDINTYCQENRESCFYYCRNINQNNDYCSQMMNFTRPGNFTRGDHTGNQGGMPPQPPQ